MTEITDFNFADDDFTAANLAKIELIKSVEVGVLNKFAELLNNIVAAKVAKLGQEKDEYYSKQLASKELESDIFYKHFPCGYFSTDKNGVINKINDTLLGWLGYAKEDIIGKVAWQSLLSVGGKMYFETHYSPLLQMQGFVQEISFEMVKKDKTRLPILINTKQIRDANGKVQINYSMVFDVSQRKSYEKELLIAKRNVEKQKKLIEYTFNTASVPIYFILEDASFYNFNDIGAKNLGYTREELFKLKFYDLDKDHDEKKLASLWAKLKVEKKIIIETQQKKKDGTLIDVLVTTNYVKFDDLELSCSFILDITEKKKQEKQLQLLDYAYKNTDSAMFFLDVNGLYIDFNQATANMLGYSYEEFKGKTIMDVNPLVTKEYWAELCGELKEISNQNFQVKLKRKDSTLIDVEVNTNSIELNGALVKFGFYKDITEKKKLEEKLKLSAFTIDNATWGLAYVKEDGTLYNCNLAFAKLYGSNSVEEMKTKTAFDFGSGYTPETWGQYWDELKQKKRLHYIAKRNKKDGTTIDLEINADMIQFGDLELNCISINDITEIKKTEAEIFSINELLQRQTNRLLLATKSAQLGIWDWDLKNNVLTWDEGMYRIYNIAEHEFDSVFEGFISRVHHEDRQRLQYEMELGIANIQEYKPEFRIVWNDSSVHYINASSIIERDNDGNAIRMIGTNWDVTAEKENMQHLKLLESVIVNTKDSILITEAEPLDEPGPKIIFVNPAFEKMTGYTSKELIGLTPRLFQNEDTDRKELDKLRAALNKWEPYEITVSNTRKNGEKFLNNFSVVPIANEKGWYTHWIAVERDVTKEKEAEEEKETLLN